MRGMKLSVKLPVLVVLSVFVSALIIFALVAYVTRNGLQDIEMKEQAISVHAYAHAASFYLKEARSALETTAALPQITDFASAGLLNPALHGVPANAAMPQRNVAASMLKNSRVFEYIMLLKADGTIYLLEPYELQVKTLRGNLAFRNWYQELMSNGKTVISDLHISNSTQRPTITIATPVRSSAGKVIGIWAGGLKLEAFSQMARAELEAGTPQRYGYITDSRGLIIAHQANLKYVQEQTDFSSVPAVRAALAGQYGTMQYICPIDGQEELGAHMPLPDTGWAVVYLVPTQVAFAPLKRLIYTTLSITVVIAFIVTIVSLVMVRRQITRPLGQLTATAENIGTGDLSQRVKVTTDDEIGQLGTEFNQMVASLSEKEAQLRDYAAQLEQKVQERTLALRESEERFRLAAESSTDLIYEWDIKERVDWFGRIDELLGYPQNEFPRTLGGWAESVHADDLDRVMAAVKNHLEKNEPYDIEYRVRKKDGTYRYWWTRGTAVRDEKGNPYRWVGAVADITEHKKAGEALERSEALLNEMGRMAKVGGWEFDVETLEQTWTEEVYRIHEVEMTYKPTVSNGIDFYASASRPIIERAVQHAIENGEPYDVELEFITAKGNHRWVHSMGKAHQENGKTRKVSGTFQDITDRKRAEEALRLANAYNRSLIEASLDPLVTIGPDGKVNDVNAATEKVTGHPRKELIGTNFMSYFSQPQKARAGYQQVFQDGFVQDYALEIRHKDGHLTPVLYNASVYRDETGQVIGVFAAARDITERKQAEEEIRKLNAELEDRVVERTAQLEAANRELEAFSYSVSHDLRAPLRAIDGFSRVILEDYIDKLDDEGKRFLNIIRNNTQKMGQLIDDLLVFSRLGRQEIRISEMDMGKLASTVFEELKLSAPERKIGLNMRTLPSSQGDSSMMRQVVTNLLSNAVKFTRAKENAMIEVGASNEGDENIYYVKDNGVGFDMQYVSKLFGVFQRLHSTEEFEGTGVGLAIVQRIIHRHGGRVWAEGKMGEGATFYFSLPAKSGFESL